MSKGLKHTFFNHLNTNYLLVLTGIIFLAAEIHRVSDFGIFLQASEAMKNGKDIYQVHYGDGFRYYYSPFFALLLYPLTAIPSYLAASLWSFISLCLLVRSFIILNGYLPVDNKSKVQNLLVIICALAVVYANFHNNQMSAFILWAILESVKQVKNKRWLLGSSILAVAINIKILPIVILPYFIYRSYFKEAILVLFFLVVFWLLPAIFVGWEYNLELLHSYWKNINPANNNNIIDIEEPGLLSLSSLLSSLLTDQFSINELGIRRHVLNLPYTTVGYLINFFRLVLIGLSLYFLRMPPFMHVKSKLHELWEISYLCLVIPLIFPHQQNYGFLLIIPAIFYLIFYFQSRLFEFKMWLPWIFVLAILLINAELIIGAYKKVFWNFKVLTYGVLLLVATLAIANPLKKRL